MGTTKNNEGRTVYLDDELKEIFTNQWSDRKRSNKLTPYVFPNIHKTDSLKAFVDRGIKPARMQRLGNDYFMT